MSTKSRSPFTSIRILGLLRDGSWCGLEVGKRRSATTFDRPASRVHLETQALDRRFGVDPGHPATCGGSQARKHRRLDDLTDVLDRIDDDRVGVTPTELERSQARLYLVEHRSGPLCPGVQPVEVSAHDRFGRRSD